MFPRVTQCPDGSWCCHQLANVNSTTCCDQGEGTFLNARGEVIDEPVSSSSSIPVSTVPIATSTSASSTASASSTPTSQPSDDGGLSTGAKIGVGVGVGVGVILLIGVAIVAGLMMKRSRKAHQESMNKKVSSMDQLQPTSSAYDSDVRAHYANQDGQYNPQYSQNEYFKPPAGSPPAEAPGSTPNDFSTHGRVEADSGNYVGELPAEPVSKSGGKR